MFTAAEDRKVIISALVLIFWHQHIIEMLEGQYPRTQEGGKVLLNRKRFDAWKTLDKKRQSFRWELFETYENILFEKIPKLLNHTYYVSAYYKCIPVHWDFVAMRLNAGGLAYDMNY